MTLCLSKLSLAAGIVSLLERASERATATDEQEREEG